MESLGFRVQPRSADMATPHQHPNAFCQNEPSQSQPNQIPAWNIVKTVSGEGVLGDLGLGHVEPLFRV